MRFRDSEIILNYIATTDSRINAKFTGTGQSMDSNDNIECTT